MDTGRLPERLRLTLEKVIDLAALMFAVEVVILVYRAIHGVTPAPEDFGAYRAGADSLRGGLSIYSSSTFVYPPTAAVAFLPFTYLTPIAAGRAWLYMEAAALIFACVMAVMPTRPVGRLVGVLFVILVLKSDVFVYGFFLGNVSVLLAPVAVGALVCFEEHRWRAGCALLVGSLLLKPLLLPLLLLPLLRGRWRDLAATVLPGAAVLLFATYALPGGTQFWGVIPHLLGGSNLVHNLSVYNLSLVGLGARLHAGTAFLPFRLIVLFVGILAVAAWSSRSQRPGSTTAAGAVILLTIFLSGTLSESHYLLVLAPTLVLALSFYRQRAALVLTAAAFALMFFPRAYVGHFLGSWEALQVRFVIAEVLMFLAMSAFIAYPRLPHTFGFRRGGLDRLAVSSRTDV